MRPSLAVRWSYAWVLAPLAVAVAVLTSMDATRQVPYGPAVVGSAGFVVRLLAPLGAAAAAGLVGPLATYLEDRPPLRSRAVALLMPMWPVLASLIAGYLASVLVTALRAGGLGMLADARAAAMAGVDLVVIAAWTTIGALAGTVLPRLLAPVVGLLAYLWLAWLPALGVPWLRHVTGDQAGCCGPASQPVPMLLALGLATTVGLLATASWGLGLRWRRQRVLAVAALGAVIVAAWAVASRLPTREAFVMEQARDDEVVCSRGQHTVCVWPEFSDRADHLRSVIDDGSVLLRASELPVDLPAVLSERPGTGDSLLDYNGQNDSQVLTNAAYAGLVVTHPDLASCSLGEPSDPMSVVALLIAGHAGASLREVAVDQASAQHARQLLELDLTQQRMWLESVLKDCER